MMVELGNSTLKQPCIVPGSCLLGLVKGIQGRVLTLWRAVGQKLHILAGVSNTSVYQGTQLATGNSYVMVSCWTKGSAGDE